MPNHVTSGVSIHHKDTTKLKELRDKLIVKRENEHDGEWETFDFNAIIPMPEEIARTGSGSMTQVVETQEEADKLNAEIKNTFDDRIDTWVLSEAENKRRLREYGATNWYDWSCEYWGTKWNAYSFSIIAEDENNLHVQFDTAWAPPTPIFKKLEEMGFKVNAVSINEDNGVEPDYYGEPEHFYVERQLEFYQ